jgi:hypothetical protein
MSPDEYTDDDTSETTETPTISERIISRYPAHNWTIIDDATLRLEAVDAYIEIGAYVADSDDNPDQIDADVEFNHPRGGEVTIGEVSLDDLPGAIGQGLAVLHAIDLATTGEPFNVDADTVPKWAVEAFVKQADEVSYGMNDLSYLKTYDADRYARRYVLAEHVRQRQKWPAEHDDEHNEPKPALASAAWWLILPTAVSEPVPARVPAWAVELKNQISEQWPDVAAAHEIGCIKAAALLLAEIARCRRVRQKAEQAERGAVCDLLTERLP